LGTAIDEVDAGNALYFVASTDAFTAFDTFFAVTNDGFAGRVDRICVSVSDESPPVDTERLGEFPKLAVCISFAEEAVVGMVGKEQFDDGSSGIDNSVGLSFDFHSCTDGKGTGGYEASLSFDFDDADAAGTCRYKTFIMTESRHIDSDSLESVKEYFAYGGIDLATIDFDLDCIGHCIGHSADGIEKSLFRIVRYFRGIATYGCAVCHARERSGVSAKVRDPRSKQGQSHPFGERFGRS